MSFSTGSTGLLRPTGPHKMSHFTELVIRVLFCTSPRCLTLRNGRHLVGSKESMVIREGPILEQLPREANAPKNYAGRADINKTISASAHLDPCISNIFGAGKKLGALCKRITCLEIHYHGTI